MNSKRIMVAAMGAALVLGSIPAPCYKGSKEGDLVDSGSFGIFVRGRRVGTETFSIHQKSDLSVISVQQKIEDGDAKASQSSEMQVASNGDLRRYEWHEASPEKAQTTVEYKDQFLVENIVLGSAKPVERAFILPASTIILDDFFTHREVLLWRYLASSCGGTIGPKGCKLETAKFGVLIPRQQASGMVALSYQGKEKMALQGAERELDHFTLQTEEQTWSCWAENTYPFRLMRILVPSEGIEVIRD